MSKHQKRRKKPTGSAKNIPQKQGNKFLPTDEQIKKLRLIALILCLIGFVAGIYLWWLHVKVHTDPGYQAFCDVGKGLSCETVALSHYSVFAGLPTAVWGVLGYVFMGLFVLWGLRTHTGTKTCPFSILFWTSLVASGISLRLFWISHVLIKSVCLVCVVTYLVNLALFALSGFVLFKYGRRPISSATAEIKTGIGGSGFLRAGLAGLLLLGAVLWLYMPVYWVAYRAAGADGLWTGSTEEGHPWIGAKNPVVTVTEFSDYQCPFCRRANGEMRELIKKHPDKLRLVHRHYPLDAKCNDNVSGGIHAFACDDASLALCAAEKRRFWEVNDYLFENNEQRSLVTVEAVAREFNLPVGELKACVAGSRTLDHLKADIAEGEHLNITGVPVFFMNDKKYRGRIPATVLEKLLGENPEPPSQSTP